jgi:hypothetical protein
MLDQKGPPIGQPIAHYNWALCLPISGYLKPGPGQNVVAAGVTPELARPFSLEPELGASDQAASEPPSPVRIN